MKIEIWLIGKNKSDAFDKAKQMYLDRMGSIHKIKFVSFKEAGHKNLQPGEIKTQESNQLLDKFERQNFHIVLDETGLQMDSVAFSKKLSQVENDPQFVKIIFCIGGAYGFSPEIRKKANLLLSLSKMTFPHKMVQLFLIEQLYRAHTIKTNHGYHKH